MAGGTFSGPRSRLQVRVRVRVRVRESGPIPVPVPEDLNLIPDGRDLGPENDFITAASFPASGLPLSWSLGRADHLWSAAVERGRSTLTQDSGCDVIASLPTQKGRRLAPLPSASQQFTMPAVPRRQAYLAGISFNVYHPSLCHRVSPAFDLISPRARWWTLPRTRPSTMRRTLSPSAETVADLMVGVV